MRWSPDGATMYITPLPVLPVAGVQSAEDAATLPGGGLVDFALFFGASSRDNDVVPGPVIGTFAYARTISHRNLFRVQLPPSLPR